MGAETKLMHAGLLSGRRLCGCRVANSRGENLGTIEDLIIDEEQGRVVYALLCFGGFLGMGNKLFAFPWAALHHDRVEKKVILDVDKESLKNAPGFDKDSWPDMADRSWGARIHRYYNTRPNWH
jgi:sporulation protein YlmC with PRC-barrel domain